MDDNHGSISRGPTMVGRMVGIRPIAPSDLEFLYQCAVDSEVAYRWRFRGAIPDRNEFASSLTNGVLVQFMVYSAVSLEPVGLVIAYNANLRDGYCYIAALTSSQYLESGLTIEGIKLLVDYLYLHWPLRKVYFESIEFNSHSYGSAFGGILVEEGRLSKHTFYDNQWWDLVTSTITREAWLELSSAFEGRLAGVQSVDRMHHDSAHNPQVLSIEEFCQMLQRELPAPNGAHAMTPESRFVEDLSYDSLGMFEIASLIDELAGGTIMEWPATVATLRDLYGTYLTAANSPLRTLEK